MYHSVKASRSRIFCLIISMCLLLGGCWGGIRLKEEKQESETDSYKISSEILIISGMEDAEKEKELNNSQQEMVASWIEDFHSRISSPAASGDLPFLEIEEEAKLVTGKIISTVCKKQLYTGIGAHGNIWWNARNIHSATGETLRLDDIFSDQNYPSFLNQKIKEVLEASPENYRDLWEEPCLMDSNQTDFYLTDKTLVLFYQPYELSYYARGVIEIPIRLESLRGYLNTELF